MTTLPKLQFLLVVLILGFLTGPRVLLAIQKLTPNDGTSTSQNSAQIVGMGEQPASQRIKNITKASPFDDLALTGSSIYVWDIATHKKLYGKNEQVQLPLASVTKIMMALVAIELLPKNTKITIRPIDLLEEGDSGLFVGEKWRFDELLKFTLVTSSNDGASAIAGVAGASLLRNASSTDALTNKKLFILRMNEKAKEIGLDNTYFSNESGLDIESLTSGAYGSARDMAMLFEYVFKKHPDLFTSTAQSSLSLKSENNIVHRVTNTNPEVSRINGIIGSKTGYTELAGGNLVVVVDIGIDHPVVISVLGSTRDGRFTDVEKLINASVKSITMESTSK